VQLSRRQIYAYLALAALVVAVGVRYVVLPRSHGPSGESLVLAPVTPAPASPAASSPAPSTNAVGEVVVYVCGAVRAPGIVRLPAGARVADALELAGGASSKAELAAVNLAATVSDGEQILVPARGQAAAVAPAAGGGSAAMPGASALVNINTASPDELDGLQGVGPATAQKIIDYRTSHGPFKTIDEIKNVPGIGDAKFAAMKDSITV
jgi:competence protein ComEA